ncbi:unnamed protein product, partial [Rhizophagus irregularis]
MGSVQNPECQNPE